MEGNINLLELVLNTDRFQIDIPENLPDNLNEDYRVLSLIGTKPVVAFVGGFSAGKSRLINFLMGRELVPVGIARTTAIPTFITGTDGDEEALLVLKDGNVLKLKMDVWEKMRDYFSHGSESSIFSMIDFIVLKVRDSSFDVVFLDTPGYSGSEKDEEVGTRFLKFADRFIFVGTIEKGTLSDSDLKFMEGLNTDKVLMVVLNKIDSVGEEDVEKIVKGVEDLLEQRFSRKLKVIPFSTIERIASEFRVYEFQIIKKILRVGMELKCSEVARKFDELTEGQFIKMEECGMLERFKHGTLQDDIIQSLKKAISVAPEDDALWFRLGRAYEDIEDFKSAVDAYKQAIAINPENENAIVRLGKVYMDIWDFDNAADTFNMISSINPIMLDYYMGILNFRNSNLDKAKQYLNKFLMSILKEEGEKLDDFDVDMVECSRQKSFIFELRCYAAKFYLGVINREIYREACGEDIRLFVNSIWGEFNILYYLNFITCSKFKLENRSYFGKKERLELIKLGVWTPSYWKSENIFIEYYRKLVEVYSYNQFYLNRRDVVKNYRDEIKKEFKNDKAFLRKLIYSVDSEEKAEERLKYIAEKCVNCVCGDGCTYMYREYGISERMKKRVYSRIWNMFHPLAYVISAEEKVNKEPDNPDAWLELGMAYEEAMMFKYAIRAYKRVLLLNGNKEIALQGIAGAKERMAMEKINLEYPI